MGWWIEHSDDLLNPLSFLIEAELKDERRHCFSSLSEVTKVVKQLCCGKAPEADEIPPDVLKALAIEGLS